MSDVELKNDVDNAFILSTSTSKPSGKDTGLLLQTKSYFYFFKILTASSISLKSLNGSSAVILTIISALNFLAAL